MHKLTIYSTTTKTTTQGNLPDNLLGGKNNHLLAQALHVYQDRQHPGLAYAKTRGEVDITKKKIYKQKGTGGARHGARSAPIFVGGGVTHGPKGIKRKLELPQAMRRSALNVALGGRAEQGRIVAINGLAQVEKTRVAGKIIDQIRADLAKGREVSVLFVVPTGATKAIRALRNIPRSMVLTMQSLNAHAVLTNSIIVFDSSLIVAEKKAATAKKIKKS